MSFDVRTIAYFDKQLKRLAKKYPSLKKEYINLIVELKINPAKGIPLGHDCYKIRLTQILPPGFETIQNYTRGGSDTNR